MKVLTKDTVWLAVELLIHTNQTTTTLEVKELLRKLNYRAEQKQVSDFMNELYDDLTGLEKTNSSDGRYQIYSFDEDYIYAEDELTASTATPSVATGAPILQTLVQTAIASRDPEFVHYTENAMITGTTDTDKWVGYSPKATEYHVYHQDLSRDQVRSRYASLLNIPIQQVRACRVKNYEMV